ncbi:MAG: hypothetical protein EOP81_13085 [Variovorax sp.]|nr:MAG: hypothetical protein EOP81_13085 [Variovorax sp.]
MFFDLFHSGSNACLKRAAGLLHEAQLARIEHQAAAEHHAALAKMYAERCRRLENEMYRGDRGTGTPTGPARDDDRSAVYALGSGRRGAVAATS